MDKISTQLKAQDVTLEEPLHGGYAGVRLGEAQNPGPAAHERDAADETCARQTRNNEAKKNAAPGSLDSMTQNLQLTDIPAGQPTHTAAAPPQLPDSWRPTQQRSRQQRDYFRCAQCGSDPEAYVGGSDSGLMGQVGHKHGGQPLPQESAAQLRHAAHHCKKDTATWDIVVDDIFPD